VVFDEDNFSLAASSNPTDLDFLCEFGSRVSTVGTRLTTAGTVAPCQPAPEVPPGFEPLSWYQWLETLANEWEVWDRGGSNPYKWGGLVGPVGHARLTRLAGHAPDQGGSGPLSEFCSSMAYICCQRFSRL
jgi:hypothetical protein